MLTSTVLTTCDGPADCPTRTVIWIGFRRKADFCLFLQYAHDLRMIYEDMIDLRSGRKFTEFEFPGPPTNDFMRTELLNWRAFRENLFWLCLRSLSIGVKNLEEGSDFVQSPRFSPETFFADSFQHCRPSRAAFRLAATNVLRASKLH